MPKCCHDNWAQAEELGYHCQAGQDSIQWCLVSAAAWLTSRSGAALPKTGSLGIMCEDVYAPVLLAHDH